MSLEVSDLIGGLVEIEVIDAQNTQKEGTQILVVEGKDMEGNQVDSIGFFGKETVESALKKGEKRDAKIFLKVPGKNVTYGEKRVNWISEPY